MRLLPIFMVIALLVTSAEAQTPTVSPPATATPGTSPATVAPSSPPPAGGLTARPITPPTHHRMTLAQRFDAANTTHDGHLTLAQAKAAHFNAVIRNYDQMDSAKKGYVTIDDIHAFNRSRHRERKAPAPSTDG